MDRRTFLATLAGSLPAAPLTVRAQQGAKVWRIGMLVVASRLDPAEAMNIAAIRDGLRAAGYVDGRNVVIDYRWAEGRLDRLNGLADELVSGKPDVIVAISEPAAVAARHATTTIPIVMPICGDPVAAGLASSLSRPGGNVTGLAQLKPEMAPKFLELLREIDPKITRVGLIFDGARVSDERSVSEMQRGAAALQMELSLGDARTADRYPAILDMLVKSRIEGLVVVASAATYPHRRLLVDFSRQRRVPMISGLSEFAEAGALMTYGPNQRAMFRMAASYIVKVLGGASPAELPIEQPTTFDLVINLKTAKALGLTIPQALLQRADQVIE